jgi:NAD(P)-dependent dehydrogenase (short-subunit alcohol dehydrogenase family)
MGLTRFISTYYCFKSNLETKTMDIPELANDCLQNKVILVTGAGDGIGRAVAKALAEHQATIILLSKTIPRLENIYDDIEQSGLPVPAIFPMDLSGITEHDVEALIDSISDTFGRLDGIIHNAAHFEALTPFTETPVELWGKTMQVNVNSPFMITKAAIPLMKKSEQASIIFTTDDVSKKGKAYWGAFCASKFAVEGMAQVLSEELENTTIRVNCLNPGQLRTKMMYRLYPGETANQFPQPESVTPAYVYLMSENSNAVHGKSIQL